MVLCNSGANTECPAKRKADGRWQPCSLTPEFRKLKSVNSLKGKPVLHSALHIRKILFTHLGEGNFFNMSAVTQAGIML